MSILTNHDIKVEIETSAGVFTELNEFMDVTETPNEVIQEYQFLNNNGFSQAEVTGMAPTLTMTGIRNLTDPAQNFLFDKKYSLLNDRRVNLRISFPEDSATTTITVNVTIGNLQEIGGAATDGTAISVTFFYNERPTVSSTAIILALTVVSVAGSTAGDTQIYVNPAKESANVYRYQVGTDLELPHTDDDVSALTAWNGTDEITAATGQQILIVEATAGNLARKAGIATVTSA